MEKKEKDREREEKLLFKIGNHLTIIPPILKKRLPEANIEGRLGEIFILRNLDNVLNDDKKSSLKRKIDFFKNIKSDFKKLAETCEKNSSLKKIDYFYGYSHLAGPLAKRFGFNVYEIKKPLKKWWTTLQSSISAKNLDGWKVKRNYKPAMLAVISRKKLLEEYRKGTYDEK